MQKSSDTFEEIALLAGTETVAATQLDANGVYQVYTSQGGSADLPCISCTAVPGGPAEKRNKPMISWHPSGHWLAVGVEETTHDLSWLPAAWQRGFLQSGIWLNMWLTTPTGDRWYQVTNFTPANGPANGFTGPAFTPEGNQAVWAEIVNGNIFENAAGVWRLYKADFKVSSNGTPGFVGTQDITPAGARWIEPGNVAPDNRHVLLSSDVGMADAEGQDQYVLDITTGNLQDLTNSPTVWDEHGMFSPDGKKVVFMSSYPYQNIPNSYKTSSLQTEFMLMNSDGSQLQQLTHFNVPGYPESQPGKTVAAVAQFVGDGSQLIATVMAPNYTFTKTNWTINFAGRCGNQGGPT